MKHPKVIKLSQLPARLPITPTIAWWLLMDRLNAPGWLWGAMGVLFVILWALAITMAVLGVEARALQGVGIPDKHPQSYMTSETGAKHE